MASAWFLMKKDLQYMLREKETILWVFVMPIVFFFFIGTITGGYGGGPVGETPLVVETSSEAGHLAEHLVPRLDAAEFRIDEPDSGNADWPRLTIPEAFTDSVLVGNPTTLQFQWR